MSFELHNMKSTPGSRRKIKRIGRGTGSGWGETAGRGENGMYKRKSGVTYVGFEGGQLPLYRRIPKRGFTNYTRKEFAIVNLDDLNKFDNEFSPKLAKETGMVKKQLSGIKILGNGKLEKALKVTAHKFSASAVKAIEAAGGEVIITEEKTRTFAKSDAHHANPDSVKD